MQSLCGTGKQGKQKRWSHEDQNFPDAPQDDTQRDAGKIGGNTLGAAQDHAQGHEGLVGILAEVFR